MFILCFSPPLDANKRYAMRTAGYTSATKVIMAFETPFWETRDQRYETLLVVVHFPD